MLWIISLYKPTYLTRHEFYLFPVLPHTLQAAHFNYIQFNGSVLIMISINCSDIN